MDKLDLNAQSRDVVGKKVASLRQKGQIPAVIYGSSVDNVNISLNQADFTKLFQRAGHNNILALKIDDKKPVNTLIHSVEYDPVTSSIIHADLYQVKMDEVIKTTVPIHFVGESTAVFKDEGTLLTNLEELEVEALPADLPQNIEVDISILDDFEKSISVADITVAKGVTVLNDTSELVVKVEPPRSDEELEQLEAEVGDAVPEGEQESDEAEASEEK